MDTRNDHQLERRLQRTRNSLVESQQRLTARNYAREERRVLAEKFQRSQPAEATTLIRTRQQYRNEHVRLETTRRRSPRPSTTSREERNVNQIRQTDRQLNSDTRNQARQIRVLDQKVGRVGTVRETYPHMETKNSTVHANNNILTLKRGQKGVISKQCEITNSENMTITRNAISPAVKFAKQNPKLADSSSVILMSPRNFQNEHNLYDTTDYKDQKKRMHAKITVYLFESYLTPKPTFMHINNNVFVYKNPTTPQIFQDVEKQNPIFPEAGDPTLYEKADPEAAIKDLQSGSEKMHENQLDEMFGGQDEWFSRTSSRVMMTSLVGCLLVANMRKNVGFST